MSGLAKYYFYHEGSNSFFIDMFAESDDSQGIVNVGEVKECTLAELKIYLKEIKHFSADTLEEFDLPEEFGDIIYSSIRNGSCDKCELSYSCNNVCLVGEATPKAKLMVIMDAPVDGQTDTSENFKLELFFKVYDNAIKDATRDEIYITYVTKCATSNNTIPDDTHAKTCMDEYLDAEIEAVKPDCILTMGEPAFKYLTDKSNVLQNHGTIYDYKGIKVMGTYHPAYVKRAEGKLDFFAKDIYKAYCISKGIVLEGERTQHRTLKTIADVEEMAKYIAEAGEVCFDIETTGLDNAGTAENEHKEDIITVIGFSINHGAGWVVPILHHENVFTEAELVEIVAILNKYIFSNEKVIKIAHNAKFDKKFCTKFGFIFKGRLEDTMLMHHLLNENMKHGLKEVGPAYYPEFKGYEDEMSTYKWDNAPLEVLAPYCVADVDLTLRLYRIFMGDLLAEPELYRLYRNFTVPTMQITNEAEECGILVDKEYLIESISVTEKQIEDAETELRSHEVLVRFEDKTKKRVLKEAITLQQEKIDNPETDRKKINAEKKLRALKAGEVILYDKINFGSPKQLGDLLYTKAGFGFPLPYVKKDRMKKRSTAAEYLNDMSDESGFLELFLKWRGYQKVLSTYLAPILEKLDKNNRVHPSYLVHGTVTGRLSCIQPNLQNIPRGNTAAIVKPMYVVEEDRVMVQVDYSQAELRIAALMANDETMLGIYAEDGDIHTTTAQEVLGVQKSVWEGLEKGEKKEHRTNAKPVNFGFIYGQQAKSFLDFAKSNYGVVFTLEEAEKFRTKYFELYSKLLLWHKRSIRNCEREGFVKTLFGRKRRPKIYNANERVKNDAEREAINAPVQGTGGELTLFAAYLLKWRLDPSTRFINTVHDSLMYSVKKDILESEMKMMKMTCENTLTEEYFGFDFGPIQMKVDVGVGTNWGNIEDVEINY